MSCARYEWSCHLRIQVVSITVTRNICGNSGCKIIHLMILWRNSHWASVARSASVPFPVVAISISVQTSRYARGPSSRAATLGGRRFDAAPSPHDSHGAQYNAPHSNSHTYHNTCVHTHKTISPVCFLSVTPQILPSQSKQFSHILRFKLRTNWKALGGNVLKTVGHTLRSDWNTLSLMNLSNSPVGCQANQYHSIE